MGAVGAGKSTTSSTPKVSGQDLDATSVSALRESMGQTGYEAGDPNTSPSQKLYVNTGKSFCINKYLTTDGKSYDAEGTDWGDLISKTWVKDAITKIDAGMKPLTSSVNLYRYIDRESLGAMLGMDLSGSKFNDLINLLSVNKTAQSEFGKTLTNADYIHKGYTSTTYVPSHGSYDNNDVKIQIVAREGTNAIVTKNDAEHEIVLDRSSKYNFTPEFSVVTSESGKKQLVINCYI